MNQNNNNNLMSFDFLGNNNNMNNNNMNNNMNMNMGNFQNQQNNINKNEFILYFQYKQKEVFLDCEPNTPLNMILGELKQKYHWMNDINIKNLVFNNKPINLNLSCNQLEIKNEDKIQIID